MVELPQAFLPLAQFNQFILWKAVQRADRVDKLPVDYRTGRVSNAHDPAIWMDVNTAIAQCARYDDSHGVGFVLTLNDPFFFIDLDSCFDGVTYTPFSQQIMQQFYGAAVEVSQSGRGVHIIGMTHPIQHACNTAKIPGLELYTSSRMLSLTGNSVIGNANVDCTASLQSFVSNYLPASYLADNQDWTDKPVEEWKGLKTDTALIKKALESQSVNSTFNGGGFEALWTRDEMSLSKAYPDVNRLYDGSSADAALATHLAFWTGNDCERIKRLMKKSALVRDKWEREDYLQRTILKAVAFNKNFHGSGPDPKRDRIDEAPVRDEFTTTFLSGYQYLSPELQVEHFKGCVYIQNIHKVFTPTGALLKSEQFNATYGGAVFQLDETGLKTTKKAWEVFTESQCIKYPIAAAKCFRPKLEPGVLIREEGETLVNIYVPVVTARKEGDASPLFDHLNRMIPDDRDNLIFKSYMSAVVQHIGTKFQWCPILQGTFGNGKTMYASCIEAAIGSRYCHRPPASEITEKFNDWLSMRLFIAVQDIKIPRSDHDDILEILKPMITDDQYSIRAMHQSQQTEQVCANFMMTTNHKDAIRVTTDNRRFAIFITAQQSKEDIDACGMGGDYFPKLYHWLREKDGFAIVANYLHTFAIPDEFNPATHCHRAPTTSTSHIAIAASLGSVEQEILDCVERSQYGFSGGWISSRALDRLLELMKMTRYVPRNKRRDILKGLGYHSHCALPNGRVHNVIPGDGGKPVLFVRSGHPAASIEGAMNATVAYVKAQGGVSEASDVAAVFKES